MAGFIDSVLQGDKASTPDYYAALGCAPASTVCVVLLSSNGFQFSMGGAALNGTAGGGLF